MNTDATSQQREEISDGLETVVVTRVREIVDDFKVRRALPSAKRRMVGPFIFLDQMGPEVLRANRGLDVAPHLTSGLPPSRIFLKANSCTATASVSCSRFVPVKLTG